MVCMGNLHAMCIDVSSLSMHIVLDVYTHDMRCVYTLRAMTMHKRSDGTEQGVDVYAHRAQCLYKVMAMCIRIAGVLPMHGRRLGTRHDPLPGPGRHDRRHPRPLYKNYDEERYRERVLHNLGQRAEKLA